ncbi:MAG: hypothetical protein WCC87_10385 [Candidatus Korobacteraceae bacterium]
MKMRVVAVTRGESHMPDGWFNHEAYAVVDRIAHLECGHEFVIPRDAPSPSHFDCRYCSRVQTVEEKDREDRRRHQAEGQWLRGAHG